MAKPEFLSPFTSGLIFLSVSLILTFALNAFYSYKLGKAQERTLKATQENTRINDGLIQSINKIRAELGFHRTMDSVPTVPLILREKWLAFQRTVLPKDTVPLIKWVLDELTLRLEREDDFQKHFESKRNLSDSSSSESDKVLHGHYQEYLAFCQSEKSSMLSFTDWKAQIGKEASRG